MRILNNLLPFLLFTRLIFAWNSFGHTIIVKLALSRLSQEEVTFFSGFLRENQTFYQAVTWPDAIRLSNSSYNHWHFRGKCLRIGFASQCGPPEPTDSENAYTKLVEAINVVSNKSEDIEIQKFYFHFVLHLMGDIHQPLHNTRFFSKYFPAGDRGGNKIIIKYQNQTINLHFFWDNLCATERGIEFLKERTFGTAAFRKLKDNNQTFFSGDPRTIEKWMTDSYRLAQRYIYTNEVVFQKSIGEQYRNICRKICRRQIVLAGLRLCSVLKHIFLSRHA